MPYWLGPEAAGDTDVYADVDVGAMGGVMPKMIVIGLLTGEDGREIGPMRRWRTAESRCGYHVEEADARVGKSRT